VAVLGVQLHVDLIGPAAHRAVLDVVLAMPHGWIDGDHHLLAAGPARVAGLAVAVEGAILFHQLVHGVVLWFDHFVHDGLFAEGRRWDQVERLSVFSFRDGCVRPPRRPGGESTQKVTLAVSSGGFCDSATDNPFMQIPSQRQQQPVAPAQVRPAATPAATKQQAVPDSAAGAERPSSPEGEKLASNLARLDGLTESLMERLRSASGDMDRGEFPAFREAAGQLESGLARLRAGLSDGTIEPADVQRGVGNLFQSVSAVLKEGRTPSSEAPEGTAADAVRAEPASSPSGEGVEATQVRAQIAAGPQGAQPSKGAPDASSAPEVGAPEVGDVVRDRFAGFAESVQARLASAEFPDQKRDAVASGVAEAFASATARLDAALFDPQTGDPIDRGTFQDLFAASFSALQEQLSFLFESGESDAGSRGVVYGSDRMAEGLAPRGKGLDVAG